MVGQSEGDNDLKEKITNAAYLVALVGFVVPTFYAMSFFEMGFRVSKEIWHAYVDGIEPFERRRK